MGADDNLPPGASLRMLEDDLAFENDGDVETWRCERCHRDVEQGDILFVGNWLCLSCAASVLEATE